jgi:hypothetical protein
VPKTAKKTTQPRQPKLQVDVSAAAATGAKGDAAATDIGRASHESERPSKATELKTG